MSQKTNTTNASAATTAQPTNNPKTGTIDRGAQGFTFAGESLMRGKYAFSPRTAQFGCGGSDTQWFGSYAEAKAAFDNAATTAQKMHHDGNGLVQPLNKEQAKVLFNKSESTAAHARRLLDEKGYRMLSETTMRNSSKLEFYAGKKGTVILQICDATNGIIAYADWPLGSTWEQMEDAI